MRLLTVSASLLGLAGLAGVTTACTGSIGGDDSLAGAPIAREATAKNVPASPEVLDSTAMCVPLASGETLMSVSPEGHAWLVSPAAGASNVRVLDPFADPMDELVESIEIADFVQLQAWSRTDAAILTADGLWLLDELARIQLNVPAEVAGTPQFCGDPGDNGFALTDGVLFERRADEQWWGWAVDATGADAPTSILPMEGECVTSDNVLWMLSDGGTLWRVDPAEATRPVRFDGVVQARVMASQALGNQIAILDSKRLLIGSGVAGALWQPWIFSGAVPRQLSAAGDYLWMESGRKLLRFDGETFVEVSHEAPRIDKIMAHAGGVWVEGGGQLCHQAVTPLIRIAGARPYARSPELNYSLSFATSDGSAPTLTQDDEELTLTQDTETGQWQGQVRLDTAGWHSLLVTAGEASRTLTLKRLPEVERSWAADIEPIYQANCTSADCHLPGATGDSPPDLSTYEAWRSLSNQAKSRVVDARTMPPAASQGPDWGEEQIVIISQWLEGGMLP